LDGESCHTVSKTPLKRLKSSGTHNVRRDSLCGGRLSTQVILSLAMADLRRELQFGIFVTPLAARAEAVLELAMLADVLGLDLVTFQDHPYQARFLDTWTLLCVVAARTANVHVAPNVANLPLRPPAVLARSVASLDILSGGRVELGLGAGAFWDGVAAMGGRRLTPGQSVEALSEALDVIRALWAAQADTVRLAGDHYQVVGAHRGPPPAHPVEIWLGAYKPRMLALTGTKADGWLPSLGYADPGELAAMGARIDEAAHAAGRRPADIRRMYNINGEFGSGSGFLRGSPAAWAQQLAALTFEAGISSFILSVASEREVRVFAEEVAPAVRELVESERGRQTPSAIAVDEHLRSPSSGGAQAGPFAVIATPDDGTRLSDARPWHEASRPSAPAPDPGRRYTRDQLAAGQHLVDVHDHLRAELSQLRDLIAQVARGTLEAGAARSFINQMTMRQNDWTLGAYCAQYCRVVTTHHSLEDQSIFPHLKRSDPGLVPVIDRLQDEHHVIAHVLDQVDRALVAMVAEEDGMPKLRAAVDLLTDTLLSHLSYEERELVEPLARLGFY
jgi:alkanesulfonate monooxygenase SsuD/methylene tetrahydromethanopterin reductase-like flavin-dependent oxidoreductase (luciferase family)/hemerythrin-like domain-containing protein